MGRLIFGWGLGWKRDSEGLGKIRFCRRKQQNDRLFYSGRKHQIYIFPLRSRDPQGIQNWAEHMWVDGEDGGRSVISQLLFSNPLTVIDAKTSVLQVNELVQITCDSHSWAARCTTNLGTKDFFSSQPNCYNVYLPLYTYVQLC